MYANKLAAERRDDPRDDVVTTLINAEIEGEKLNELEFDMFMLLLTVAGNETTRNAMSHGMHALLTGDPLRALDHNLLLVFVVPLALWMWARWFLRSWRGVSPPVTDGQQRRWTRFTVAVLVLAIAFGVLRNFVPYLGSTA